MASNEPCSIALTEVRHTPSVNNAETPSIILLSSRPAVSKPVVVVVGVVVVVV